MLGLNVKVLAAPAGLHDRVFTQFRQKAEKRSVRRHRRVAARVAMALKPVPILGIPRPAKPCTSVRFRFAPPKETN